ncbi:MAG: glycosyltransferase family 2 protein, partial [Asticcacaulis sp.]
MMPDSLPTVCVIIPTFRRPQGLMTALQSVRLQGFKDRLSVIVCDNSPEASGRDQVEAFAKTADFPVVFVHEPKTGVANARNSAVAACTADFIAFLDDDEEAPEGWLARLMAAQAQFAADVVFGPVEARLSAASQALDAHYKGYFTRFFSRFGPEASQILDVYYGCGNSLIRRAVLPVDALPFS